MNIEKNIFLFFLFFLFFLLISCSKKQIQQDLPLDGDFYTIDLDAKKEISIPLSSFFKSVQTIILENRKECLIGNISEIQVFNEFIYILDSRKTKSLFVFDMEGRFIRKIGGLGNGPGEYIEPNDFTLDIENGIIYICDIRNRVLKYSLDGTYIHTITIQAPLSNIAFIQFYNGSLYSNHIWWDKSEGNYLLLEIDTSDGKILNSALPLSYNKGWNELFFDSYSRFFMTRANNPPKFNMMFMDYIVSIGKEITPYIKLKSENLTTEKDIDDFRSKKVLPFEVGKIMKSSKNFNVHCYIENENYIMFRYGFSSRFTVIFNKKTKETKLATYLRNDLIFNQNQKERLGEFLFSNSKGAYSILDTQRGNELYDFQSAIEKNIIVPELDKLEQLKQLDDDSNPVIFFYEYK